MQVCHKRKKGREDIMDTTFFVDEERGVHSYVAVERNWHGDRPMAANIVLANGLPNVYSAEEIDYQVSCLRKQLASAARCAKRFVGRTRPSCRAEAPMPKGIVVFDLP